MSNILLSVEQAAEELRLHPKTVLRYIRDGRLPATRVGKSYRITRDKLDAFAGAASGRAEAALRARTTCVVDIPAIAAGQAERLALFLQSAALSGDATTPPLHFQTAFDPLTESMKVVMIGASSDVAKLLTMLHLQLGDR